MSLLNKKILHAACIAGVCLTINGINAEAADYEKASELDISYDVSGCYDDIAALHDEGVRVFDTAGLLSDEEREALGAALDTVSENTGFDIAVFTAEDISGYERTQDYADDIYDNAGFGYGVDNSGCILVMETYGNGNAYISTAGDAIRYITDRGIDYIFDEIDNGSGVWTYFAEGDYYKACTLFAEGVELLYSEGISEDQANYDTETGELDPYYEPEPKKRSLDPLEILAAIAISLIAGILPVKSVKASYAMKGEKARANGINQAYMAASGYKHTSSSGSRFINKFVTSRKIESPSNDSNSGHGGGISSTHTSSGGVTHGGGGRGAR
ncbi:MAG: TPM domain-containing protein [Lachnospiraceae bacterium]|nr:TPM domain-containing protein [Lachnospiraceae bacterium]